MNTEGCWLATVIFPNKEEEEVCLVADPFQ